MRIISRYSTLLVLSTIIAPVIYAQSTAFTIHGTYSGRLPVVLRLAYNNGKSVADSVTVMDGKFSFSGLLAEPVAAFFSGATKSRSVDDPNFNSIFIGPGDMQLHVKQDAFKQLELSGSAMQDDSREYEKSIEPIRKDMQPLTDAYKAANETYMLAVKQKRPEEELTKLKEKAAAIRDQFDPFSDRIRDVEIAFIQSHPASYYSAYLMRFVISDMRVADAVTAYKAFAPAVQQSMAGKQVAEEVKKLAAGSPGSAAYVFATTDINQRPISLSDFAGKQYVLLDFWASWCVPCRHGNPHLLELYKHYKSKGLEIIGISDDDRDIPAWKTAVAKDGIGVWRHVLRGLKMNGHDFDRSADISDRYGIHTLPTKILIDKTGRIIGRYGGGGEDDAALDKKLAELM